MTWVTPWFSLTDLESELCKPGWQTLTCLFFPGDNVVPEELILDWQAILHTDVHPSQLHLEQAFPAVADLDESFL